MNLAVFPVQRDEIAAIWEAAGEPLARALRHGRGEYEPRHVRARLEDGRWLLWLARERTSADVLGLAVTEVVSTEPDLAPHLWVTMGAGRYPVCVVEAMFPALREHAAATGCSQIRFLGRLGWSASGAVPTCFRRTHELWSAPVEE